METVEIVIAQEVGEASQAAAVSGFQHAFAAFMTLFLFCLVLRYFRSLGRANGSF